MAVDDLALGNMKATLEVYRTRSLRRSQRYGWRCTTPNGRIIAASGEGYTHADEARRMGIRVTCGLYDITVVTPS